MLFIPSRKEYKNKRPIGKVALRENHWATQGLVHYSHMSPDQQYDLVSGTAVSAVGSANNWLPIGLNCNSTASYIAYPYTVLPSGFAKITIFVTLRHNFAYTDSPAVYPVISEWCNGTYLVNNTQTAGYRIIATNGTARPRFRSYHPAGTNLDCSSSPTWEINERFCYAFVFDGAEKRVYRKSTLIGSLSQTGNIAAPTTGQLIVGGGLQLGYANSIIEQFAIYDRALSVEEINALNAESYSMLKPDTQAIILFMATTGGSTALSGDALSQASASSALLTAIQAAGAAVIIGTVSGTMSTSVDMSAAAISISVSTLAIDAFIDMQGDASGQTDAVASLTTGGGLEGSAAGESTAQGIVTVQINFSGQAIGQALAVAGIDAGILFTASAAGEASVSGDLSTGNTLSAAASAESSAAATLTAQVQLSVSALVEALAQAGLTVPTNGLESVALGSASVSGTLVTGIDMTAAPSAIVTAAGDLSKPIDLLGVSVSVVSASGTLNIALPLSGDAAMLVSAGADLIASIDLSASALIQALAQATLAGVVTETPTYRRIVIPREDRTITIPGETMEYYR